MAKNNRPRKRLTPDEKARVIAMYKKGRRVVEIAEIIGIVPPTVSRIAQKSGLDSRMAVAIRSQGDRNQKIVDRYVNDLSVGVDEIGADFGISGQRVTKIAQSAGAPRRAILFLSKGSHNANTQAGRVGKAK